MQIDIFHVKINSVHEYIKYFLSKMFLSSLVFVYEGLNTIGT